MKKPVPIRSSVAHIPDAPSGRHQNPAAKSAAKNMQNTHVRTPRPANSLSVIHPAKIVPTTAASSKAMIIMPPFDTGMPLYSFRKVGPQSRNPKRTTYTKKFASAQSQITRLRKTSLRLSASVT